MNPKNVFGCIVLFLILAACQKDTSTLVSDSNWADITLQAKGFGSIHLENSSPDTVNRVESYQMAKQDLYQKLETDLLNLKIDAKRDVKTFVGTNQKTKEKILGFLKGARITEAVYTPGKGMELKAQLYLGEGFKSILGLMERKPSEEKNGSRPQTSPPAGSGF